MTPDEALDVADRLAAPDAAGLPIDRAWWPQSLAHGALGVAALHAEVAAVGARPWQRAHDWVAVAARSSVTTGTSAGLFYGAPALATTLTGISDVSAGAYHGTRVALDEQVAKDARRRVDAASARIDARRLPLLAEFDAIRGLAGVGRYLLRAAPGGDALRATLEYLVALTRPLRDGGVEVPGWWAPTGPTGRLDVEFPGGHGNAGMAHGVSGPLALLSLATQQGVIVAGQLEAIEAICAWLDAWRIDTAAGSTWPYMVRRAELAAGRLHRASAEVIRRPSWCYGTAGVARAIQLAAVATGDDGRRRRAEAALVGALGDPAHRRATVDGSLCHGHAGLAHIARCAAHDADEPTGDMLRRLAGELLAIADHPGGSDPGLLEGSAGVALAALAPSTGRPITGWDTCLLVA